MPAFLAQILLSAIYAYTDDTEIIISVGKAIRLLFSRCVNTIAHVFAMFSKDIFSDLVRRVEASLAIRVLSIPESSIDYHGVVIHPMYKDKPTRAYLQILKILFISNLRRRPVTIVQGVDFGSSDMDITSDTHQKDVASTSKAQIETKHEITEDVFAEGTISNIPDHRKSRKSSDKPSSRNTQANSRVNPDRRSHSARERSSDREENGSSGISIGERQVENRTEGNSQMNVDLDDTADQDDDGDQGDESEDGQGQEMDVMMSEVAALQQSSESEEKDMIGFSFDPRLLVSLTVDEPVKDAEERIALEEFVNEAISEEMDYLLDVVVLLDTAVVTALG